MMHSRCVIRSSDFSKSVSQMRKFSSSVKKASSKVLSVQIMSNEDRPFVTLCGKGKLKAAFQRYYSVKSQWNWKLTKFNSVVLDLTASLDSATNPDAFLSSLDKHMAQWSDEDKRGVWIKVPVQQSWVVAELYSRDFELHHAKLDYIMMKKWLQMDVEDKMPRYAFHTVGVSGFVLNEETSEVLVVQDRAKTQLWKFPGGFAEPNENIGDTAVREVMEETGVKSEFQSLLAFRQQHGMGFDQSDLYFICHLKPLSYDITTCPTEIIKCQWHPLEKLITADDATPMTRLVANIALQGVKNGFQDVHITSHEMTSWVPPYDKKFKVFHRPIEVV